MIDIELNEIDYRSITGIKIDDEIIDIKYKKNIVAKVANFLFNKGYLNKNDVPISSGFSRYIVNVEKIHKDGSKFFYPFKLDNGLYVETHNSPKNSCKYAIKLVKRSRLDNKKVKFIF